MGRRPSPTGTPAESSGGWQDVSFDKSDVLTVAATNPVRTPTPLQRFGERLLEGLPSVAREPISAPGSIRPNGGRMLTSLIAGNERCCPRAVSGHVAAPRSRGWPMSEVSMPATGRLKRESPTGAGRGSPVVTLHLASLSAILLESATCRDNPDEAEMVPNGACPPFAACCGAQPSPDRKAPRKHPPPCKAT